MFGLYFDNQKCTKQHRIYRHRDRVKEEHISNIFKSGSSVFSKRDAVKCIKQGGFECLTARSVHLGSVEVVGCDETVVNTERSGGVMQKFEELPQQHAATASVLITC